LVAVLYKEADGGAESDAALDTTEDGYGILLFAVRGDNALARATPVELDLDIGFTELNTWWAAVNNSADTGTV
jgi:hypothetical protein